jgi:hypothetical protein
MRPSSPRLLAFLAAAVLGTAVLAGCSGSDEPAPKPAATSIAELDTITMDLARVAFCDLVPAKAVTAALTGAGTTAEDWGNGDRPPLDDAGSDVTHEFGCSWSRSGGFAARAWVFARPVTAGFGEQVIASTSARKGCTTRRSTAFGKPGLLQTCPLPQQRGRVRHAGLFGDTWLTCEVAGPAGRAAPRQRADAWCAAVASALDADR